MRSLEVLNLVSRLPPIDHCDLSVSLAVRAIEQFHFHWPPLRRLVFARNRRSFPASRSHESVIAADQLTLHNA